MSPRTLPRADALRRVLAAGCAMLVLALTVFAASPVAHEWLHLDEATDRADDGCGVVLFATGVSLPLAPITAPLPGETSPLVLTAAASELFLVTPRYLRQPERGPPASWVG